MARVVRDSDTRQPAGANEWHWLILAGALVVVLTFTSVVINASLLAGGKPLLINPIAAVRGVITGDIQLGLASWIAGAFLVVLVAAVSMVALKSKKKARQSPTAARAARVMARPAELGSLAGKEAHSKAQRLYPAANPKDDPLSIGLMIGKTVAKPETTLWMSWEDTAVVLAGQRMGKTQAYVTTSILGAPGACVATANKRDVVDLTRAGREEKGKVWIFDLQHIATTGQRTWWWNPLDQVHSVADARKLANYFASATRGDAAKADPYFDSAAQELLAVYILAAAKGGGDLVHVLEWLNSDQDETPVEILRASGESAAAHSASSSIHTNPRQKEGFFKMALNFIACLTDSNYASAVTPEQRVMLSVEGGEIVAEKSGLGGDDTLPKFDPIAFATSTDTVYALSVEGPDSPAPLTTALVGQIIDAGQKVARQIVGGRLETPMVCVLDEAANVVRLQELPSLYSYCGSQGIVLLTFLQSRSQAQRQWGRDGARAMMESSNFIIYGGGIKDKEFLAEISSIIGNMRVERTSSSRGSHINYNTSYEKEEILGVDDLAAVSAAEAIIISSGNRPTLTKKIFWSDSPFKDVVEGSMRQAKREQGG